MLRNADVSNRPKPNQRTPSGEAFTRLILEAFRFNGCLLAAGDRLTQDLGLTSARWQVLGAIDEGPLPVAQISRNMGLSRQAVQRSPTNLPLAGLSPSRTIPIIGAPNSRVLRRGGGRRSTRLPGGRSRGPIASQLASTHRWWKRRQMFFWLSGPGLKRTPRTQDKTPMYKIAEAPHFLRLAMFLAASSPS